MTTHKNEPPALAAGDLRALLRFLPIFEAAEFRTGEMRAAPGSLPFSVLAPEANEFISELHDRGFVYPFDWPGWATNANEFFERPQLLEDASLDTIRRLFVVIVRRERFCEGTILDAFESGFVVAALRRLAKLVALDR